MEKVQKITYMTAFFMFLNELRPYDPYNAAYLTGPDGNVSLSEVANVIETIKVYSALIVGVLLLITADYLLYKPNIILLAAWSSLSYLLLTGSASVTRLRVSTVGFGAMFNTTNLAISYLYAQIEDKTQYHMATGIVTSSALLGRFVGDLLGQYIVYTTGGSYTLLPYITATSLFMSLIWSIFFPPVERKKHFIKCEDESNEKSSLIEWSTENMKTYYENHGEVGHNKNKPVVQVTAVLKEIWSNLKTSYHNPIVFKRCSWIIVGMVAYIEVLANINILYSYVVEESSNQNVFSNGIAEALVTLSGAAGAYLIGRIRLDWIYYSDLFTAFCSTFMGVLIISLYFYSHIYFIYISYILFGFICQAHIVVVYTGIANHLEKQCYTAVLELNFIITQILVSITIFLLVQWNFMHITIPGRFLFFGGYYVVLGIIFALNSGFEFFK